MVKQRSDFTFMRENYIHLDSIGAEDVYKRQGIGSDYQRLQSALQKRGAGGQSVDQQGQQQEQCAAQHVRCV